MAQWVDEFDSILKCSTRILFENCEPWPLSQLENLDLPGILRLWLGNMQLKPRVIG